MQHLKNIMKCYDDKDCLSGCVWDKKTDLKSKSGICLALGEIQGSEWPSSARGTDGRWHFGTTLARATRSESSSLSRDSSIAHFRTWCTRLVKEVDIFPEWDDSVSLCHVFLLSTYSYRGRKTKGHLIFKPFFSGCISFSWLVILGVLAAHRPLISIVHR